MKNFFLSIFILSSLFAHGQSTEQYLYKPQFQPNKRYKMVSAQKDSMFMSRHTLDGVDITEDTIQKKNPPVTRDIKTVYVINSGKISENKNEFPMIVDIESYELDGEKSPWTGARLFGHCTFGQLSVFDSISQIPTIDIFEDAIMKILQNSMPQIQPTEHLLKIGESFTDTFPTEILTPDQHTLNLNTYQTLKLIDVQNGVLFFDCTFFATGSMTDPIVATNMEMSATGKIHYDAAAGFYIFMSSKMDTTVVSSGEGITVEVYNKTEIVQTIDITNQE